MCITEGHALFNTAIGRCAIAWGLRGIAGVQLPEASDANTRSRLLRYTGPSPEVTALGETPTEAQAAIAQITLLLAGAPYDLSALVLDLAGLTEFQRRVYAVTCAIPAGQTLTYGEIAAELGNAKLARAVGRALGSNPFAPVIPCHRALAAGHRAGGFPAHRGAATKLRMLAAEGVPQPAGAG